MSYRVFIINVPYMLPWFFTSTFVILHPEIKPSIVHLLSSQSWVYWWIRHVTKFFQLGFSQDYLIFYRRLIFILGGFFVRFLNFYFLWVCLGRLTFIISLGRFWCWNISCLFFVCQSTSCLYLLFKIWNEGLVLRFWEFLMFTRFVFL